MARLKPEQPERLAEKLKQIRLALGFTQEKMLNALQEVTHKEAKLHFGYITRFETGTRTPSLLILLAYAHLASISTDVLIDDTLELPDKFHHL